MESSAAVGKSLDTVKAAERLMTSLDIVTEEVARREAFRKTQEAKQKALTAKANEAESDSDSSSSSDSDSDSDERGGNKKTNKVSKKTKKAAAPTPAPAKMPKNPKLMNLSLSEFKLKMLRSVPAQELESTLLTLSFFDVGRLFDWLLGAFHWWRWLRIVCGCGWMLIWLERGLNSSFHPSRLVLCQCCWSRQSCWKKVVTQSS